MQVSVPILKKMRSFRGWISYDSNDDSALYQQYVSDSSYRLFFFSCLSQA